MANGFVGWAVGLRSTGPAWIGKLISSVVANESRPVLFLKELLARGVSVPAAPRPRADARVRLLFAPFNYAGQGTAWAQSAETQGDKADGVSISAQSLALASGSFSFPASVTIHAGAFIGSRQWRDSFDAALGRYTHIVIESFGSLRGRGTGRVVLDEIRELERRGIHVALLCHGSDIRSPRTAASRPGGPPLEAWGDRLKHLQRSTDENRLVLDEFPGSVFVSTPDLLIDAPEATWLPLVIDVQSWENADAESPRTMPSLPPRVLHIPSNSQVKGSARIDDVATRLHEAGVIHYTRANNVPHSQMPKIVAQSDIVIDQLLAGSYGVAACEAMSAGRAVVSHVSADVRSLAANAAGVDLPIIEADSDTLESVLTTLATSPQTITDAGIAGQAFVRLLHSGRQTLPALSAFLDLPGSSGDRLTL